MSKTYFFRVFPSGKIFYENKLFPPKKVRQQLSKISSSTLKPSKTSTLYSIKKSYRYDDSQKDDDLWEIYLPLKEQNYYVTVNKHNRYRNKDKKRKNSNYNDDDDSIFGDNDNDIEQMCNEVDFMEHLKGLIKKYKIN